MKERYTEESLRIHCYFGTNADQPPLRGYSQPRWRYIVCVPKMPADLSSPACGGHNAKKDLIEFSP